MKSKKSPSDVRKVGPSFLGGSPGVWRTALFVLCIVGMMACVYAYVVETRKEANAGYEAACDISESISCSKVFTSRYGRGFGLVEHIFGNTSSLNQPNSVFGLVFYSAQVLLGLLKSNHGLVVQLGMSILSNIGSVYLACILYFVLHDFCVVCVSIYVINFLILFCNLAMLKIRQRSRDTLSCSTHPKQTVLTENKLKKKLN